MQAYLLTKSLFKTSEYKLDNSHCLEITELTASKAQSKKIQLNSINYEESQSLPSFIPWLIFLVGCTLITSMLYLSQYSSTLSNNILNAIAFLSCSTIALAFLTKPIKTIKYRDIYSNSILFEITNDDKGSILQNNFIDDLKTAIEKAKTEESNKTNLMPNAKQQYEMHNKNVDDLFNLGLIDEALYNRVCSSIPNVLPLQ